MRLGTKCTFKGGRSNPFRLSARTAFRVEQKREATRARSQDVNKANKDIRAALNGTGFGLLTAMA
jgi:hypothetical protein